MANKFRVNTLVLSGSEVTASNGSLFIDGSQVQGGGGSSIQNGITGFGTDNYIPIFTNNSGITNSIILVNNNFAEISGGLKSIISGLTNYGVGPTNTGVGLFLINPTAGNNSLGSQIPPCIVFSGNRFVSDTVDGGFTGNVGYLWRLSASGITGSRQDAIPVLSLDVSTGNSAPFQRVAYFTYQYYGLPTATFGNININNADVNGYIQSTSFGQFNGGIITPGPITTFGNALLFNTPIVVNGSGNFGSLYVTGIPVLTGLVAGSNVTVQNNNNGTFTITSLTGGGGTSVTNAVTGFGTNNYIPKFTNNSGLINSNIIDSGNQVQFLISNQNLPSGIFFINSGGHILFNQDNAYDIGTFGNGFNPRGIHSSSYLYSSGPVYAKQGGNPSDASVVSQRWTLASNGSPGVLQLLDNSLTDFNKVQFGGNTSSFPAIVKSGNSFQLRLADDSAFTNLTLKDLTSTGNLYVSGGVNFTKPGGILTLESPDGFSLNFLRNGSELAQLNNAGNFNVASLTLNGDTTLTKQATNIFSLPGLTVTNSLGVGTSAPISRLDVTGNITASGAAFLNRPTVTGLPVLLSGEGNINITNNNFTTTGGITGAGTEFRVPRFTLNNGVINSNITSNGSLVGINQPNPTEELEVSGTISVYNNNSINFITATGSSEFYQQINLRNSYTGRNASSDLVATADFGNEITGYVDLGINSSTYSGAYIGYSGDAYLYSQANDFYIGNPVRNKRLFLFANNAPTGLNSVLMTLEENQVRVSGNLFASGGQVVTSNLLSGTSVLIYNDERNSANYQLSAALSGMKSIIITPAMISRYSRLMLEAEVFSSANADAAANPVFTWTLGWATGNVNFQKQFTHRIPTNSTAGIDGGGTWHGTIKTITTGLLPATGTTCVLQAQCGTSNVLNVMRADSFRVYGII